MFLTIAELEMLTERKRKADQVAWLRKQRIPYLTGANGHPRVSRAYVENILAGRPDANEPEPNFAAIMPRAVTESHGAKTHNA